jgi:hypothetical protein
MIEHRTAGRSRECMRYKVLKLTDGLQGGARVGSVLESTGETGSFSGRIQLELNNLPGHATWWFESHHVIPWVGFLVDKDALTRKMR